MKISGFNIAKRSLASLWLLFALSFCALKTSAQSNTTINISRKTITVKELLQEAEKQSGYSFVYSSRFSGVDKSITLDVTNGNLKDILTDVSNKAQLRFEFIGNQVSVREITKKEQAKQQPAIVEPSMSTRQLEEFEVASYKARFAKKESNNIAKLPIKNLENPQVYSTISQELLREQMTTDLTYAIRNTVGVYKIQGNRGINSDGATFYTLRGFRTEASMIDGVPGQTNGELDPANVERIEVLRGPSATLYGGALTSFGGLINIVSKKPIERFGGEVSYITGSYNMNRITADVYGPLSADSSLLFRVNAAYLNTQNFQDVGFKKSAFVAPSLQYRSANGRLNVFLNAEFYQSEATNPSTIFLNRTRQFIAKTPDETNFDWERGYTSSDITMKNPTMNVRAQILYKLSEKWSSQTIISSNTRKSNGYYQYQFIRKVNSDDSLERNVSLQNTTNTAIDVQQNFTGDFRIAGLRNRLVVGLDYVNMRVNNDNSPYIVFDFVDGSLNDDKNYTKISRYALDARLAASTADATRNHGTTEIYSVYASDVLNITDRLLAMLSVRLDKFDSKGTINHATNQAVANTKFDKTAVSPKFGIVYELVKDQVSLFTNYMNGFSYIPPVTQPLPEISGAMKPQQANQIEGGVKMDLFRNRLAITASYYDIKVDNMTRTENYEKDGSNYNITVQNGTQVSRGFELEIISTPLPGLNLVAGYAHNDSKLVKAAAAVEGRRPPNAGPADLVNSWIGYTQPNGKFKGLGIGFGANYIGDHMTANSSATGVFTLPSYTILNATAFYEAKKFRLGLKFDNITNERYFTGQGTLTPQMPLNVTANVAVKF